MTLVAQSDFMLLLFDFGGVFFGFSRIPLSWIFFDAVDDGETLFAIQCDVLSLLVRFVRRMHFASLLVREGDFPRYSSFVRSVSWFIYKYNMGYIYIVVVSFLFHLFHIYSLRRI